MIRRFQFILITLFFLGCAKKEQPPLNRQCVVNCILQPGHLISAEISQTFSSPRGYGSAITIALVVLYKNGHVIDTMDISSDGLYKSDSLAERVVTYRLEVYPENGNPLTAQTHIPAQASFEILEVDSSMAQGEPKYDYTLLVNLNNPDLEILHLYYQAFPQDTMPTDNLIEGLTVKFDPTLEEAPFLTFTGSYKGEIKISASRPIVHSFTIMSHELFLLFKAWDKFTASGSDFGYIVPPTTPTNINGGTGFFSFYDNYLIQ